MPSLLSQHQTHHLLALAARIEALLVVLDLVDRSAPASSGLASDTRRVLRDLSRALAGIPFQTPLPTLARGPAQPVALVLGLLQSQETIRMIFRAQGLADAKQSSKLQGFYPRRSEAA